MTLSRLLAIRLVTAILTLEVAPVVAAPITISTVPAWDGTSSIGDFGSAGFSAWGQFVTAPTGTNRLLDFTFIVSDAIQGPAPQYRHVPVEFTAHVVEYDPSTRMVVGPVLYSSSSVTVPLTDTLVFKPYTFTPDAQVEADSVYLMFLFATNFALSVPDDSRLRMASSNANTYGGGAYNIPLGAGSDFDDLLTAPWRFTAGDDLAFSARFDRTPVPEPGSMALLIGALLAAVGTGHVGAGGATRSCRVRMRDGFDAGA